MNVLLDTLPEVVAIVSSVAAFSLTCFWAASRSQRRTFHLQTVVEAHRRRAEAVEMLRDPEYPIELAQFVDGLTAIVGDRMAAHAFIEWVEHGAPGRDEAVGAGVQEQARLLRDIRPDLSQATSTVMAATIAILILRWPETASKFEALSIGLLSNERDRLAGAAWLARLKARAPDLDLQSPSGLAPA